MAGQSVTGLTAGRMLVRKCLESQLVQVSGQVSSASFLLLQTLCCKENSDNKTCEIPAHISCNTGTISEEEQLFSGVGTVIQVQNKEMSD